MINRQITTPVCVAFFVALSFLLTGPARAELILPECFSDGMVLQRPDNTIRSINKAAPLIWGWCGKDETVSVSVGGKEREAVREKDQHLNLYLWHVSANQFAGLKYGPETIEIQLKTKPRGFGSGKPIGDPRKLHVLIGEVWILRTRPEVGATVHGSLLKSTNPHLRICSLSLLQWTRLNKTMTPTSESSVWKELGPNLLNQIRICSEFVHVATNITGTATNPVGLIPLVFERPEPEGLITLTANWEDNTPSIPPKFSELVPSLKRGREAAYQAWEAEDLDLQRKLEQLRREGKVFQGRRPESPIGLSEKRFRFVNGGLPQIPQYVRGVIE